MFQTVCDTFRFDIRSLDHTDKVEVIENAIHEIQLLFFADF